MIMEVKESSKKKVGIIDYIQESGYFDRTPIELNDFISSVYSDARIRDFDYIPINTKSSLPSQNTRSKLRKKRKRKSN
jgi:hypothetical protein